MSWKILNYQVKEELRPEKAWAKITFTGRKKLKFLSHRHLLLPKLRIDLRNKVRGRRVRRRLRLSKTEGWRKPWRKEPHGTSKTQLLTLKATLLWGTKAQCSQTGASRRICPCRSESSGAFRGKTPTEALEWSPWLSTLQTPSNWLRRRLSKRTTSKESILSVTARQSL